jgi:hypothetical protein
LRFPPLGRQQRKIKQSRSITRAVRESKAELKSSLDTIEQDIKDGRGESQGGFMRIIADIAMIAQEGRLTATKLNRLEKIINVLNLPDYKQTGLRTALDQKQYRQEDHLMLISHQQFSKRPESQLHDGKGLISRTEMILLGI